MATSTGHVRKRRYQPTITDFFSHGSSDLTSSSSPQLPEETQASLLTVGMRVRKSVPEGYKTHKTIVSSILPSPASTSRANVIASDRQQLRGSTHELVPFCGLFKTGGLASQQMPRPSVAAAMQYPEFAAGVVDDDDSVPALSFSQTTPQSSQESSTSYSFQEFGTRKRTYEDDTEVGLDSYFSEIAAADSSPEQIAKPPRRIAKMKSTPLTTFNSTQTFPITVDDDFEDAPFLTPMDTYG